MVQHRHFVAGQKTVDFSIFFLAFSDFLDSFLPFLVSFLPSLLVPDWLYCCQAENTLVTDCRHDTYRWRNTIGCCWVEKNGRGLGLVSRPVIGRFEHLPVVVGFAVLTWDDGDGFERSQDSKGPQGLEVAHFDKLSEQPAGGSVASAATQTHGTEQAQGVTNSSEKQNSCCVHAVVSCSRI